jgi:streptogramin lyase
LDSKDGSVREFAMPNAFEAPMDLAVDARGALWFAGRKGRALMLFDPLAESFDVFPLPSGNSVESLTVGADGKVYFSLRRTGKIGVFDPENGQFLEVKAGLGDSHPKGIAVDQGGDIWFADIRKNALFKVDGRAVSKLWLK